MIPQTPGHPTTSQHARRLFLSYLAHSVLLANGASRGVLSALLGSLPAAALAQRYDVLRAQSKKYGDIIAAPEDALEVMDFEPAAKKALPPAHYGYLATGGGRRFDLAREFGRLREDPYQGEKAG
jgi:hypothetical protein